MTTTVATTTMVREWRVNNDDDCDNRGRRWGGGEGGKIIRGWRGKRIKSRGREGKKKKKNNNNKLWYLPIVKICQ